MTIKPIDGASLQLSPPTCVQGPDGDCACPVAETKSAEARVVATSKNLRIFFLSRRADTGNDDCILSQPERRALCVAISKSRAAETARLRLNRLPACEHDRPLRHIRFSFSSETLNFVSPR